MHVAKTDLDDRQPVNKLHKSAAVLIERSATKQQQRRKGERECVVGQEIRDGRDRTGEEQRHEPQWIGIAARAEYPEYRRG